MKGLQKFLFGLAVSVSGYGAEFKLPENFLVFDPSRILSAMATAAPKAAPMLLASPKIKTDICAHIRIITPPSDVDPRIALPEGNYTQSKMPILQAPPACQSQVR